MDNMTNHAHSPVALLVSPDDKNSAKKKSGISPGKMEVVPFENKNTVSLEPKSPAIPRTRKSKSKTISLNLKPNNNTKPNNEQKQKERILLLKTNYPKISDPIDALVSSLDNPIHINFVLSRFEKINNDTSQQLLKILKYISHQEEVDPDDELRKSLDKLQKTNNTMASETGSFGLSSVQGVDSLGQSFRQFRDPKNKPQPQNIFYLVVSKYLDYLSSPVQPIPISVEDFAKTSSLTILSSFRGIKRFKTLFKNNDWEWKYSPWMCCVVPKGVQFPDTNNGAQTFIKKSKSKSKKNKIFVQWAENVSYQMGTIIKYLCKQDNTMSLPVDNSAFSHAVYHIGISKTGLLGPLQTNDPNFPTDFKVVYTGKASKNLDDMMKISQGGHTSATEKLIKYLLSQYFFYFRYTEVLSCPQLHPNINKDEPKLKDLMDALEYLDRHNVSGLVNTHT